MYRRSLTPVPSPHRAPLRTYVDRVSIATATFFNALRPGLALLTACLSLVFQPMAASAEEFPTVSPSQLPGSLQELYAREQPGLGQYGHCAAGFDSRTDGLKMALSCSIYVRSSAQGARLAVKLCNERAAFLKIKARCSLIVD